MLKTNLKLGTLQINEKLIFDLINSCIIEIPGVKGLADFKLFLNKSDFDQTKSISTTLKKAWKKKSIDVKWDQNTKIYNLDIHVILKINVNVHSIMSSITERVLYELKEHLNLEIVKIHIYIEDFGA